MLRALNLAFFFISFMPLAHAVVRAPADTLDKRTIRDTLYIYEVEDKFEGPDKVLHAEPLFIDLIRDLGARQGEAE